MTKIKNAKTFYIYTTKYYLDSLFAKKLFLCFSSLFLRLFVFARISHISVSYWTFAATLMFSACMAFTFSFFPLLFLLSVLCPRLNWLTDSFCMRVKMHAARRSISEQSHCDYEQKEDRVDKHRIPWARFTIKHQKWSEEFWDCRDCEMPGTVRCDW